MTEFLISKGRIGCVPGVDFGANWRRLRALLLRARPEELTGALESMRALFASDSWSPAESAATGLSVIRYRTCRPPSTRMVSPVTKSDSSRNTTAVHDCLFAAPAPQRRRGRHFLLFLVDVPGGATIGPGAIAFTRI